MLPITLAAKVSVQRLGDPREKAQFGAVQMARRRTQSLPQPCRSSSSVLIYLCIFKAIFGIGTGDWPMSAVITSDGRIHAKGGRFPPAPSNHLEPRMGIPLGKYHYEPHSVRSSCNGSYFD